MSSTDVCKYVDLFYGNGATDRFFEDGLDKIFGDRFFSEVKDPKIELISENEAVFSGEFSGVRLHFCVKAEGRRSDWQTEKR